MLAERLLVLLLSYTAVSGQQAVNNATRNFPAGFVFGSGSAAYQVEGAVAEDGRTENMWDAYIHNHTCAINDCSNADITSDSYHNVARDVQMMRELGLDFYRFSISWNRVLPTSFPDQINELGVKYYNNLIDEMLKYNIKPMVTLYHWDLPEKLNKMGGWTNTYSAQWFADYARVVFQLFGDRVKLWNTFNEPHVICHRGYGQNGLMPRININGVADYMCTKNVLMAHAKAYHIYDDEFRASQNGSIFIVLSAPYFEPATQNETDIAAAEDANAFMLGQYANPIFSSTGDFPRIVKERIANKSAEQGYPRSRLPELSAEEIQYIKGTSDNIFGLNHYTTYLVTRNESVAGLYEVPSFEDDLGIIYFTPSDWVPSPVADWIMFVPWGFRKILNKIKDDYNNPTVYVTENGFATNGTERVDDDRISYHRQYLSAMLDAIEDGCNVIGYGAWSLMDNWMWSYGYTQLLGLYEVDFTSANRTVTPRKSAFVYKEMLRNRTLDFSFEPNTTTMSIDEGH